MQTEEQIKSFLADPANFLLGLDIEQGNLQFVYMPREEVAMKPFLDKRALEPRHNKSAVPGDPILQVLKGGNFNLKTSTANYLFHTSFCCSTLISRCLDIPGRNLSLKEPYPLLGLSVLKRTSKDLTPDKDVWDNWCNLSLPLMSRPFIGDEKILIKPSNGANNILQEILQYPGTGKVVLLYNPLAYFLAAITSGGQERFSYIGGILRLFIRDFGAGLDLPDMAMMNMLQWAGMVWGLQMKSFREAAEAFPDKVRTLDYRHFLDNPLEVLHKLNRFYGLGISDAELAEIVAGPVMSTHAKKVDKAVSMESHKAEFSKILLEKEKDFSAIVQWCNDLGLGFPEGLPNSLLAAQ